jgi:hypothetical protein
MGRNKQQSGRLWTGICALPEREGAYPGHDAVGSFYSQHAVDSMITIPEESIFSRI